MWRKQITGINFNQEKKTNYFVPQPFSVLIYTSPKLKYNMGISLLSDFIAQFSLFHFKSLQWYNRFWNQNPCRSWPISWTKLSFFSIFFETFSNPLLICFCMRLISGFICVVMFNLLLVLAIHAWLVCFRMSSLFASFWLRPEEDRLNTVSIWLNFRSSTGSSVWGCVRPNRDETLLFIFSSLLFSYYCSLHPNATKMSKQTQH